MRKKPTSKKPKTTLRDSMVMELKDDLMESFIDAFFKDRKVKRMLKNAEPFINLLLKTLSAILGKDKNRIFLFYDKGTGAIYLMKTKTKDILEMTMKNVESSNFIRLDKNYIDHLKKFKL